ncbi:endonuclease/exonuclease/phosphatase family metal-dependent hydrolase [Neolewinella xylanilytica]|uniref:Endonuclease/exonuclease/phosphatase family metal-dependent hydrolase n=1 Tax=Neolewinella xylanilytica TaxID=1514080 RepID=A0A2S6I5U3_9BACT|nr:endonuclease/exonuclease/phosphatase family protein [Neolewinella xylanilytica]PPK86481.1 endonuclease/exonuclease/phosphatase family metal-dependent hydrolase [Neolewinella xylanilytica]
MRNLWRFLRIPLAILVLYLSVILIYGTATDWQPTGVTPLDASAGRTGTETVIQDSLLRFLTWNVGYGGLGADDYFFYNRGDFFWTDLGKVRSPEANVTRYVAGQELTVTSTQSDFFFLQEVDTASRRSYFINQLAAAREARPDYSAYYAPNFQSNRVPIPLFQPWDHYGGVQSGLVTLSRYRPTRSERLQLPGEFPWPTRLFQLDRCALRQVFTTAFGPDLVVYNLHLSAYDSDGSLRREQMRYLREQVLEDYAAGNYVVAGGDWNQIPPGFSWFSLNPTVEETILPPGIDFDYLPPGWAWAYDPAAATVRKSDEAYDSHRSEKSVIDFFLCSPNIRLRRIKTIDQDFQFSDHQPVYLEAELLR